MDEEYDVIVLGTGLKVIFYNRVRVIRVYDKCEYK